LTTSLSAQFDDLYYNPDDNNTYYETETTTEYDADYDEYAYGYDDESYEDFDYWSEYDSYYQSRIRRFHRPYGRFGYNSACYADPYFFNSYSYDQYYGNVGYRSGRFIIVYDRFGFRHRRWVPSFGPYYGGVMDGTMDGTMVSITVHHTEGTVGTMDGTMVTTGMVETLLAQIHMMVIMAQELEEVQVAVIKEEPMVLD